MLNTQSFFPDDSFFYSSSLNSFIKDFIEKNGLITPEKLFSYIKTEPFPKDFSHFKKLGPVYSMHRYWTKQPIEVIEKYIHHFCPPDGIVLDPFCGSGTTGTAALYSKRKIILSDLSPIATFIAKNYTETTDLIAIEKSFNTLKYEMQPILDKYYNTNCPNCGNKASIKDWIYAENYVCPICSKSIPFILNDDTTDFEKITSRKHSKNVLCENCQVQLLRNTLKTIEPSVIGLRYSCNFCKARKNFKALDENDYSVIYDKSLKSSMEMFLKIPLPVGVSTNQAINKGILYVNQFFTPVTFTILTKLWSVITLLPTEIKSKYQFIFSSILFRVTKLYRLRVNGQGGVLSGTLYIPPIFQDINVWDVFNERYKKISRGWKELNRHLPENFNEKRIISTHSATHLPISDNSIDYVYTDPPYGGNINYSELNFLWESWFNLTTNIANEVIINEIGQNKDLKEYERLFALSLNEIYRVLKPGSWCSLVFNSSSSKIWSSVQKAIRNSKFHLSQDVYSVKSNMTTAKQTQSLKTARNYMILNLFKGEFNSNNPPFQSSTFKFLNSTELEEFMVAEIKKLIEESPEQILDYNSIYDHVISKIVPNYTFEEFNLEILLTKYFKQIKKDYWSIL